MLQGREPPRAFSDEKAHPSGGGNGGDCNLKGALPVRGLLRRLAPPRNDEGTLEMWSALQGGEPPRAFSGEKAHPSRGGEWGDYNLKRALPVRGLLRRACASSQ